MMIFFDEFYHHNSGS